jgi:putative peptidoglycan binding protein
MNGKRFITTSILAAGCMMFDGGSAWSQSTGPDAKDRQIIHPDISSPNTSTGGTRSERTSPGGAPLPECSPFGGTTGQVKNSNAVENCSNDSAQDQKQQNRRQSRRSGWDQSQASATQVREAQEALREKGYDPGPIDGIAGMKTRQAIRSFQKESELAVTGTLTDQTMDKLGVESDASSRVPMNK